jgi:hypothetical protein
MSDWREWSEWLEWVKWVIEVSGASEW